MRGWRNRKWHHRKGTTGNAKHGQGKDMGEKRHHHHGDDSDHGQERIDTRKQGQETIDTRIAGTRDNRHANRRPAFKHTKKRSKKKKKKKDQQDCKTKHQPNNPLFGHHTPCLCVCLCVYVRACLCVGGRGSALGSFYDLLWLFL